MFYHEDYIDNKSFSQEGQRPGGASARQGVFQERGHPGAEARPTTHNHVVEKMRLQVVPPRQAEALDIGDGASGLPVPRAVPQECPVVRRPGRGRWRGVELGLGGGGGRVLPVIEI